MEPVTTPSGNALDYAAFPSSKHLIFYPEGTASSNGTFTFCDARGSGQAKALILAKRAACARAARPAPAPR